MTRYALVLFALILLVPDPTHGQTLLETHTDARSEGMGHAFSVLDRSAFSAWGNVGGLAFVRGLHLSGSHAGTSSFDPQQSSGSILKSFDVGSRNIAVDANIARFTLGSGISPSSIREESIVGAAGAVRLTRNLGLGVGLKRVSVSEYVDPVEGYCDECLIFNHAVLAFDVGMLARIPATLGGGDQAAFELLGGIAVRNMGPDLERERGDSEPLPREIVAGIGGEFRSGSDRGFEARGLARRDAPFLSFSAGGAVRSVRTVESDYPSTNSKRISATGISGGGEASLRRVFFVRAGYLDDDATDNIGWTWGGGLAVRSLVGFDFARVPHSFFGRETTISLWIRLPV